MAAVPHLSGFAKFFTVNSAMNKKKHAWFRPRRYIHFDPPIGFKKAALIIQKPNLVAKHAFYPLLKHEVKIKKIKKSTSGKFEVLLKERPIAYAAHLDSHIYSYYAFLLNQKCEQKIKILGIEKCVLAFRSLGKSNIEFANEAFTEIEKKGACSVLALDISQFFDRLDHKILKDQWKEVLGQQKLPDDHYAVYKSLTKYSFVNRDILFKHLGISKNHPKKGRIRICNTDEFRKQVRTSGLIEVNNNQYGIPQGSPISALLSNIYMLDFDSQVNKYMQKVGGTYFRYCDDMLFIVPHGEKIPTINFAEREVKKKRLEINKTKLVITDFHIRKARLNADKPLQYLGFMYDGQRKLIRSASLARNSERMKRGVRWAKLIKVKYNRLRIKNGQKPKKLYKRKLYDLYSHLGKRNFVRYGFRSAKIMGSKAIKMQIKPIWNKLIEEIKK